MDDQLAVAEGASLTIDWRGLRSGNSPSKAADDCDADIWDRWIVFRAALHEANDAEAEAV